MCLTMSRLCLVPSGFILFLLEQLLLRDPGLQGDWIATEEPSPPAHHVCKEHRCPLGWGSLIISMSQEVPSTILAPRKIQHINDSSHNSIIFSIYLGQSIFSQKP